MAVDDDLREWWVGDRKDNRDRKFGGLEVPSLLALLVQKYKYCGGLEVLTLLALLVQKYNTHAAGEAARW